jgi:hypothetical protein
MNSMGAGARRPAAQAQRAVCIPLVLVASSLFAASPARAGAGTAPAFGHVFVIVGENTSLSQLNIANAPYIVSTLMPGSAWFTNYNDVVSGSLADYVALTSGQYASCETVGPCGKQTVPSIFSQLASGSWDDWNESMPSDCSGSRAGSDSTLNAYKPGHNPALYYAGLPCSAYDVPAGTTGPDDMSAFNDALAGGTVPRYNFVAPNLCEDSHDSCNGASKVTEFDSFLRREIPLIQASPAFGPDGVIFVTYDENATSPASANTMMAVIGPQVQAGTYAGYFDHYSALATIEQGLGLSCLANACTAAPFPVFGDVPSPSVTITQPADGSTVSGSVTVTGTATAQGGASISRVQVSSDGGAAQTATGGVDWSAGIDTAQLANGAHTITATATDSNGLTAAASIAVSVSNPVTTSCPAPAPGATELSQNPSAEAGQTGWTGVYSSNSTVARVEPPGGSYDGLWALQAGIKSGSGKGGISNANPLWVSSASQGKVYTGTVFVQASVAGEQVSLTLAEKAPGGVAVGAHTTTVTLNDTSWHQISDPYTAQRTGDSLRYSVHAALASTSQHFLADCLSLHSN